MFNFIDGGVTAPKGFLASGIHCGIRKNKSKKDLALIVSETECDAAAVYTKNLVYGAPITVTRKNIADGKAKAIVCNSGIANTCNADGVEKAEKFFNIENLSDPENIEILHHINNALKFLPNAERLLTNKKLIEDKIPSWYRHVEYNISRIVQNDITFLLILQYFPVIFIKK